LIIERSLTFVDTASWVCFVREKGVGMIKICTRCFIVLLLLSFLVVGVGCSSEPAIDASSEAAFKQSVQEIYKSIPENKRKHFKKTISGMGVLVAMAKQGNQEEVRKFFDGMTYDDIMEKAKEIRNKVRQ